MRSCLVSLALSLVATSLGAQSLTFTTLVRSNASVDGTGTAARFWLMAGGTGDPNGNLYVFDRFGQVLRKVTPAGVVSTLVANDSSFFPVTGVATAAGDLYFVNMTSSTIRKRAADGTFSTIYTRNASGFGPFLIQRNQLVMGAAGTFYAADSFAIWRLSAPDTAVLVAGATSSDPNPLGYADGPLGTARFNSVGAPVVNPDGVIYAIDQLGTVIRRIGTDGVTTTFAGTAGSTGTADGTGAGARFNGASALFCDAGGVLYVGDKSAIRKVTPQGVVTTLVAAGTIGGVASLSGDASGNLYAFDSGLSVVWKIAADGTTTLLAGSPTPTVPGTPNTVPLATPAGVAVDADGGVVFSDAATHTVSRFSGSVTTIAGRAGASGSADGFGSVTGRVGVASGIVLDTDGSLLYSDGSGNAIRRLSANGALTTFAGRLGSSGAADGTGRNARFSAPGQMVRDAAGNLIVMDSQNCAIRKVTPASVVTTIAGRLGSCGNADGDATTARFGHGGGIAIDGSGTLFVSDVANNAIRRVATDGSVSTLAAGLRNLGAIGVDSAGNVYASVHWALKQVSAAGVVTTAAGSENVFGAADGSAATATFGWMSSLVFAPDGTLFIADGGRLRKLSAGVVSTVAGGSSGGGAIDGTGTSAQFEGLIAMTLAGDGTLYVTDFRTLRRVSPAGVVDTLAGSVYDSDGVDGVGRADARLTSPHGVTAAPDGTLFIADTGNHTIRRLADNQLSTLAGAAGMPGISDGSGSAARFTSPTGLARAANGNLVVADTGNHTIRLVSPAGAVTTLAGQAGVAGAADGDGTGATFNAPRGVAVDAAGTIYIADTGNHVIRAISPAGAVITLAGTAGVSGSADGTGADARFNAPSGVVVVGATIFVDDTGNHTIRAVTTAGAVTTVGGAAGTPALVDGAGAAARFNAPAALATDQAGTLYVADTGNGAIRFAMIGTPTAPVLTSSPQSRSVTLHGSVQLTCDATGSPSPTFSWQRLYGTNVGTPGGNTTGSTTRTLTINDVGRADDGTRYRCVATNAAGTVNSPYATLSVPVLNAAPGQLVFTGVAAAGGGYSTMTSTRIVNITWPGAGAVTWNGVADKPWIQVTGGSGSGSGQFTVAAGDPGALSFGSVSGTITVDAGDPELGLTIPVKFYSVSTDAAPIGVIDTPASNATGLQGSLAVTGWALDDVDIDHVEIWRDAVAGETTPVYGGGGPGNGKIFIANATFVPGARPDVEALYGGARPGAHDAGWGYMLLTQGLWNQGNGTYTLYAFAFDKIGKYSTIGAKTITIDNANASKPFGTIDTPSYGGTVSGTIQNFGWALTPGTACSISNPNVLVSVDSGTLTPVIYGDNRTDIAGAFPGYTNAAAAGGHFTLDTTTLANGMHTIGWFVTDSCARADGIGSRFFTVANAASISMPGLKTRPATDVTDVGRSFSTSAADVGRSFSSGADVGRSFSSGAPGDLATDGTRVVRVAQTARIEVPLPGDAPYTAGPLPIGSSFDAATNTFMWQPGPGFLGAYDLAFTAGNRIERLRVVVGPPVRMTIDTPHAGGEMHGSGFTIAGWAVDLGSSDGAGIDTLHVWAYPTAGGAPVFVGVAKSGGGRPDVAALYGASFTGAGFTLDGALAPGTYDLVVYAHSAATNVFEGAQTVRVIVR